MRGREGCEKYLGRGRTGGWAVWQMVKDLITVENTCALPLVAPGRAWQRSYRAVRALPRGSGGVLTDTRLPTYRVPGAVSAFGAFRLLRPLSYLTPGGT